MVAQSARVLEDERHRRKETCEAIQSRADAEEINRRIKAFGDGKSEMYSRDEAKSLLEQMVYHG